MNSEYTLKVGSAGATRLALLDKFYGHNSHRLLSEINLHEGQTVLEIGCGTGNMTCYLAEEVGLNGHVYAIDISAAQIEIARKKTLAKNYHNITFIESSVFDLANIPLVDIIYTRFIIMHLSKPYEALEHILKFLKIDGTFVCEETTNAVWVCEPMNEAYAKLRKLFIDLCLIKGLDPKIGHKLYAYFQRLGLNQIQSQFVQPVFNHSWQKQLVLMIFNELKETFLQYHLLDDRESSQLEQGLTDFINDDRYFFSFPQVTQIYGRKTCHEN